MAGPDQPSTALDELYDAVAPGSFLAVDFNSEELAADPRALAMTGPEFPMRAPAAFGPVLGRWVPTADGIVPVARWRPDGRPAPMPDAFYGGSRRSPPPPDRAATRHRPAGHRAGRYGAPITDRCGPATGRHFVAGTGRPVVSRPPYDSCPTAIVALGG
ncbi:hypothetical protein [Micromonospora rhizosphaerae]|uniref:hypothetical protein n=1 Tax=Micromonospora rhizosphaerae TaxID=568872 RepID=UPI001FDFC4ED|nr:hypothetical protein [Micromonospora rhizosphaerae]